MFNGRNDSAVFRRNAGAVLRILNTCIQRPNFRRSRQINTFEDNTAVFRRWPNCQRNITTGMQADTF